VLSAGKNNQLLIGQSQKRTSSTRVIHFFSFTGRKEMNKSAIATMLNRITNAGNKKINN
jgi:hypothetical protein